LLDACQFCKEPLPPHVQLGAAAKEALRVELRTAAKVESDRAHDAKMRRGPEGTGDAGFDHGDFGGGE
jgi:hypothetical protein